MHTVSAVYCTRAKGTWQWGLCPMWHGRSQPECGTGAKLPAPALHEKQPIAERKGPAAKKRYANQSDTKEKDNEIAAKLGRHAGQSAGSPMVPSSLP